MLPGIWDTLLDTFQLCLAKFNTFWHIMTHDWPRTSQDMDVWLTLIFTKSETTWDIITKISAFLQLMKKWILSKFGGCSSKIELATPKWCLWRFWREIQILCIKNLHTGSPCNSRPWISRICNSQFLKSLKMPAFYNIS